MRVTVVLALSIVMLGYSMGETDMAVQNVDGEDGDGSVERQMQQYHIDSTDQADRIDEALDNDLPIEKSQTSDGASADSLNAEINALSAPDDDEQLGDSPSVDEKAEKTRASEAAAKVADVAAEAGTKTSEKDAKDRTKKELDGKTVEAAEKKRIAEGTEKKTADADAQRKRAAERSEKDAESKNKEAEAEKAAEETASLAKENADKATAKGAEKEKVAKEVVIAVKEEAVKASVRAIEASKEQSDKQQTSELKQKADMKDERDRAIANESLNEKRKLEANRDTFLENEKMKKVAEERIRISEEETEKQNTLNVVSKKKQERLGKIAARLAKTQKLESDVESSSSVFDKLSYVAMTTMSKEQDAKKAVDIGRKQVRTASRAVSSARRERRAAREAQMRLKKRAEIKKQKTVVKVKSELVKEAKKALKVLKQQLNALYAQRKSMGKAAVSAAKKAARGARNRLEAVEVLKTWNSALVRTAEAREAIINQKDTVVNEKKAKTDLDEKKMRANLAVVDAMKINTELKKVDKANKSVLAAAGTAKSQEQDRENRKEADAKIAANQAKVRLGNIGTEIKQSKERLSGLALKLKSLEEWNERAIKVDTRQREKVIKAKSKVVALQQAAEGTQKSVSEQAEKIREMDSYKEAKRKQTKADIADTDKKIRQTRVQIDLDDESSKVRKEKLKSARAVLVSDRLKDKAVQDKVGQAQAALSAAAEAENKVTVRMTGLRNLLEKAQKAAVVQGAGSVANDALASANVGYEQGEKAFTVASQQKAAQTKVADDLAANEKKSKAKILEDEFQLNVDAAREKGAKEGVVSQRQKLRKSKADLRESTDKSNTESSNEASEKITNAKFVKKLKTALAKTQEHAAIVAANQAKFEGVEMGDKKKTQVAIASVAAEKNKIAAVAKQLNALRKEKWNQIKRIVAGSPNTLKQRRTELGKESRETDEKENIALANADLLKDKQKKVSDKRMMILQEIKTLINQRKDVLEGLMKARVASLKGEESRALQTKSLQASKRAAYVLEARIEISASKIVSLDELIKNQKANEASAEVSVTSLDKKITTVTDQIAALQYNLDEKKKNAAVLNAALKIATATAAAQVTLKFDLASPVSPAYSSCKASSVWSNDRIGVGHHGFGNLDASSAWSSGNGGQSVGDWWQMDTGSTQMIGAVTTQGRANYDQWVTSYAVQYSTDGNIWLGVDGDKTFPGNTDRGTKVTNKFTKPVTARYIRIVVRSSYGHASMRAGYSIATINTEAAKNETDKVKAAAIAAEASAKIASAAVETEEKQLSKPQVMLASLQDSRKQFKMDAEFAKTRSEQKGKEKKQAEDEMTELKAKLASEKVEKAKIQEAMSAQKKATDEAVDTATTKERNLKNGVSTHQTEALALERQLATVAIQVEGAKNLKRRLASKLKRIKLHQGVVVDVQNEENEHKARINKFRMDENAKIEASLKRVAIAEASVRSATQDAANAKKDKADSAAMESKAKKDAADAERVLQEDLKNTERAEKEKATRTITFAEQEKTKANRKLIRVLETKVTMMKQRVIDAQAAQAKTEEEINGTLGKKEILGKTSNVDSDTKLRVLQNKLRVSEETAEEAEATARSDLETARNEDEDAAKELEKVTLSQELAVETARSTGLMIEDLLKAIDKAKKMLGNGSSKQTDAEKVAEKAIRNTITKRTKEVEDLQNKVAAQKKEAEDQKQLYIKTAEKEREKKDAVSDREKQVEKAKLVVENVEEANEGGNKVAQKMEHIAMMLAAQQKEAMKRDRTLQKAIKVVKATEKELAEAAMAPASQGQEKAKLEEEIKLVKENMKQMAEKTQPNRI